MIYFLLFVLGLCVGSFLNVLIYREAKEEKTVLRSSHPGGEIKITPRVNKARKLKNWLPSWMIGRSYCDHCRRKIAWFDNIPLLSFVLLKGKCRWCRKKIPFQYPLIEFLTGLEFIWVYFLIQSNLNFFSRFEGFYSLLSLAMWVGIGACFLAIFAADWRWQIIPDTAVFGGIIIALFKILVDYRYTGMIDFSFFYSALLAGLFFAGLVLATKGKGMGIGDVKLSVLMGLILGFPRILVALSFAFLTGALIGVILILAGKKKLKSKIAFGPFLIAGTIFALFIVLSEV